MSLRLVPRGPPHLCGRTAYGSEVNKGSPASPNKSREETKCKSGGPGHGGVDSWGDPSGPGVTRAFGAAFPSSAGLVGLLVPEMATWQHSDIT